MTQNSSDLKTGLEPKFWFFLILTLIGIFVLVSLLVVYGDTSDQREGWIIGFIAFLALTLWSGRKLLTVSNDMNDLVDEAEVMSGPTENFIKKIKSGALSEFSADQWKRILPEKPGRTVYGHPDKSGPVKLSKINEVAKYIDRALDVFYEGGSSAAVERQLAHAGVRIPLPHGDGDEDYISYGEDQRPHMMALIDEIRAALKLFADRDENNPRYKILSAKNEDICSLSVQNRNMSGGWQNSLLAEFEKDPHVFDLDWNSGYHYTTGESSGSAAQAVADGEIEVGNFYMKCIAEHYPDILDRFKCATVSKSDRIEFYINDTGHHYGDGSDGEISSLFYRLRQDERIFALKKFTSRNYDGPEGTDDNHTAYEDIREDHFLEFACETSVAKQVKSDVEAMFERSQIGNKLSLSVRKN